MFARTALWYSREPSSNALSCHYLAWEKTKCPGSETQPQVVLVEAYLTLHHDTFSALL